MWFFFFFFQAEDGIRDIGVTGVQTCALPILWRHLVPGSAAHAGNRRAHGAGRNTRRGRPAGARARRALDLCRSRARRNRIVVLGALARSHAVPCLGAGSMDIGGCRSRIVGNCHAGGLGAVAACGAGGSHAGPAAGVRRKPRPSGSGLRERGLAPASSCYTGISPYLRRLRYMFDLFRSRDKIVRIMLGGLLLVVALSMLTYLVPSYNMGGSGGSDQVVAEIGKEAITVPEVQQFVQMNLRGRQLPAELMPHYVPQIINSMLTGRALAFEAKRLGFKVSEEDLAAYIRQRIPQLFQDGKFAGKDAYAQVLAQQNLTIPQFEEDMARELLVTKMQDVALEGTVVTPQEIEQEYRRRNDKVKIQYRSEEHTSELQSRQYLVCRLL